MLNYAPSTAPLPTPDGSEVIGQFTTLAVGFAVFQVFTVDYVGAGVRKAKVGTPTRQTASPLRSPSSGRTVCARAMSRGPRPPSRTTALTSWPTGTWSSSAELLEPQDRCMPWAWLTVEAVAVGPSRARPALPRQRPSAAADPRRRLGATLS
jgi:hypothetical protein